MEHKSYKEIVSQAIWAVQAANTSERSPLIERRYHIEAQLTFIVLLQICEQLINWQVFDPCL